MAEQKQLSATSSALNTTTLPVGSSGDGPRKHTDDLGERKPEDAPGNMPTKQELLNDLSLFIKSVDWYFISVICL